MKAFVWYPNWPGPCPGWILNVVYRCKPWVMGHLDRNVSYAWSEEAYAWRVAIERAEQS